MSQRCDNSILYLVPLTDSPYSLELEILVLKYKVFGEIFNLSPNYLSRVFSVRLT